MEKKMLIAQIGRGDYRLTSYGMLKNAEESAVNRKIMPGSDSETGYTFEAVLHDLKQRKNETIDTVVLIGTDTSYWGSLCYYYMKGGVKPTNKEEIEATQKELHDALKTKAVEWKGNDNGYGGYSVKGIAGDGNDQVKASVERLLSELLGKKYEGVDVKIIILKKGVAKDELKDNFGLLQKGLEEVVEGYYKAEGIDREKTETPYNIGMYLDISNGFRSLPMYIYSFASYLTRIHRENYKMHMYYGMADAQDKYGGSEKDIAPLVELNEVTDLMHWINAVNEFRNFGSVRELGEIFRRNSQLNTKIKNSNFRLLELFEMFDYATNSHNLKALEDTIKVFCSLRNLGKDQKELPQDQRLPDQAVVLLEDIGRDFEKRFHSKDTRFKYGKLTLDLAEWFYDQDRMGSASLALTEGMVTYVMERFESELHQRPVKNKYNGKNITIPKDTIQWLFLYSMRDAAKDYVKAGLETNAKLWAEYKSIKDNIRNTGAHFGYSQVGKNSIKNYRKAIRLMMNEIKNDMKREDKRSLFYKAVYNSNKA